MKILKQFIIVSIIPIISIIVLYLIRGWLFIYFNAEPPITNFNTFFILLIISCLVLTIYIGLYILDESESIIYKDGERVVKMWQKNTIIDKYIDDDTSYWLRQSIAKVVLISNKWYHIDKYKCYMCGNMLNFIKIYRRKNRNCNTCLEKYTTYMCKSCGFFMIPEQKGCHPGF